MADRSWVRKMADRARVADDTIIPLGSRSSFIRLSRML